MNKQAELYTQKLREIGPIAWAEGPHGWVENGQPVVLTDWQRAALTAYWEHRETVSTIAFSNIKKTGKTFLNAVLTAYRWLSLPGQHYTCGNDLDQSTGRHFSMIADMVKNNSFLYENCKIKKGELVFTLTGSTLTALASDSTGNAGSNHLTASYTELWGVIYENGIRSYDELTPPPGKTYGLPALRIVDSYAGYEPASETWHKLVDRGLAGERMPGNEWPIWINGGLLLFHMTGEEAKERCFRGTEAERLEYYREQAASLRPNAFARMHNNERTTGEGSFIPSEAWDACYSADVRAMDIRDDRHIVLAADASTTRDLTALVGCLYNRETRISDVVYCRTWHPAPDPSRGKPTIDLDGIKGEILRMHKGHNVAAVYFDPFQMHSIAADLRKEGVRMIELPQTTKRIEADQALYDAIISRSIRHYGDPTLNEHVRNAAALETPRGFRISKQHSALKIDAAVALSMANYGSRKHSAVRKAATMWEG